MRVSRPRVGVLVSGTGSNLQALIDACTSGYLDADIAVVVSHNPAAGALRRAEAAGIPAHVVQCADRRDAAARARMEDDLEAVLESYDVDLLVLAGWMLVLSERFLARCPFPLLNVHPALLPLSGGLQDVLDPMREALPIDRPLPVLRGAHAVRDALALDLPQTGVSVHVVTAEVDGGPVVAREVVTIEETDDEESLYRRIKPVEHRLLVAAVRSVLSPVPTGGVHA